MHNPYETYNAQIMGKKLLAKIATQEQKPTVFCPVNLLVSSKVN
jgi:hypothetical protein